MFRIIFQALRASERKERKNLYVLSFFLAVFIFFTNATSITAFASSSTSTYVDPKLGFSLQVPNTWKAHTYPGSNGSKTTSGVTFSISSQPQDQIGITVIQNKANPQAFAQRGTPPLYIGGHPAFSYDTPKQKQYPLACTIRVMLVENDLVTATWCSTHSYNRAHRFESILATYEPSGSIKPGALHTNAVNPVESCQDVINTYGSTYGVGYGNWGSQQGNPTDAQWTGTFNPGAAVCDNFIDSSNPYSGYLFQCVELANRFAREQWGITPGFTVNAAQYFDYYQNGTFFQGQARTLYQNNVQLSSDASQGTSTFAPTPGDLLIWQSVTNPSQGWTSGLTSGPGHVAVITKVDASHVYIAQQNYSESQYYATLSLTKVSNGWAITGLPFYDTGIITRGWIHFNANPYSTGTTGSGGGPTPDDNDSSTYVAKNSNGLLEVFARGADNNIWHIWQNSTTSWSGWSPIQSGMKFQGDPTVAANADGRLEVFARGNDNNIWHAWQQGSTWSGWIAIQPGYAFQGTPAVAKNSSGQLEVFARGNDNHIWHVWQQGTGWSGWGNLQSSGTYASSPIVTANKNGLLEVFARNSDNNIWHVWQQSTTSWSGWIALQTGQAFKGTPAVGQNVDGRLEVFARGTDNNMRHIWQTQPGVSWSTWTTLTSGATLSGNPAVGVNNDGRLEVYARGSDNNLYHMWQTTAGTAWDGGWVALQPNYGFQGTASAGTDADGRVEVFALGSDNNLWHIWQTTAGTTWSGWIALQPNYGFVQ